MNPAYDFAGQVALITPLLGRRRQTTTYRTFVRVRDLARAARFPPPPLKGFKALRNFRFIRSVPPFGAVQPTGLARERTRASTTFVPGFINRCSIH